MPTVTYINVSDVVNTRPGRPESDKAKELRAYATDNIAIALETGKAMDIRLGEDERPSTVQAAFKRAAGAAGAKVKFFNVDTRDHVNSRSKETEKETCQFQVIVTMLESGETAEEVEDADEDEDEDGTDEDTEEEEEDSEEESDS